MNNIEKKIESMFSAALSLQEAGESEKVIGILEEIIHIEPSFVDAYILKGAILQQENDFDAAESSYRRALELKPDHPEAMQGLGLLLVSQKRYEESIAYLRKYLEQFPDDEGSLNGIIKALSHFPDRSDDILDVLQQAWVKSNNIDIGLKFAHVLSIIKKDKIEAYKVFKDILKISKTPKLLTEFALSCWYFDDYDMAIDLLKKGIKIDPSYIRAWRLLADCYYRKNEFSKALETIEEAIALDPNDYRNWRLKTDVFIKKKELEKALVSAEKGIELLKKDPEKFEALADSLINPLFQKIFILFKQEEVDKALEAAAAAKNLIPNNRHFYLYPAQKLTEMGRQHEALELLESAEDPELNQYFVSYRYLLLHRLNRIEEAKSLIESKLHENPEKAESLAEIAADEYIDGERKLAISIYSQLIKLCPDRIRLKTNLGYMLIGEGAFEQAESILNDIKNVKIINQDEEEFILIAKCNLAYLHIIQSRFDQAFLLMEDILLYDKSEEEAILRIPVWFHEEIHPDPAQYPGRDVTLEMAALGCGLAAALAQGDIEKAEKFSSDLTSKECEDPLPLVCLGSLEAEKGNKEQAIDAWNKAITISENEEEKTILKKWVEILENKH